MLAFILHYVVKNNKINLATNRASVNINISRTVNRRATDDFILFYNLPGNNYAGRYEL